MGLSFILMLSWHLPPIVGHATSFWDQTVCSRIHKYIDYRNKVTLNIEINNCIYAIYVSVQNFWIHFKTMSLIWVCLESCCESFLGSTKKKRNQVCTSWPGEWWGIRVPAGDTGGVTSPITSGEEKGNLNGRRMLGTVSITTTSFWDSPHQGP